MRMGRIAALLCATLLVGACAGDRPASCGRIVAQPGLPSLIGTGPSAPAAKLNRLILLPPEDGRSIREGMAKRLAALDAADLKKERPVRILALSTGGAWGAYGAGVLNAWRQLNPDETGIELGGEKTWRHFDVVTGSSTGALLAPLVYLGRPSDMTSLRSNYTSISDTDVFTERSILSLLWSDALFDTAPLRKRLGRIVTPALIEAVAAEYRSSGRILAVTAANMDTGEADVFDLGAYAADDSIPIETRVRGFIDRIMAASAIPIAFDPVFVDGCMYTDGGVRQHLLVTAEVAAEVAKAADLLSESPQDERTGRPTVEAGRLPTDGSVRKAELHLIVNGDIRVTVADTQRGLLNISRRTFTLITDEGLRAGIERLRLLGDDLGWSVKYTDAWDITLPPGPAKEECEPDIVDGRVRPISDNKDMFDPCFNKKLFQLAFDKTCARKADVWEDPYQSPGPLFVDNATSQSVRGSCAANAD